MIEAVYATRSEIQKAIETCGKLMADGRKSEAVEFASNLADEIPENRSDLAALCDLAKLIERHTWKFLYFHRYLDVFTNDTLTRARLAQLYIVHDQIRDGAFQAELAISHADAPLETLQIAYDVLIRAQTTPGPMMLSLAHRALMYAPDSVRERARYMSAVAFYNGKEAALPLIEEMRQFAAADFTSWMAVARLQAELGQVKEAKRDFDIGARYLPATDLAARYRLIETAEKLHLYGVILEHVRFLDDHGYSDIRAWDHLFSMGLNTLPNAVANIAAINLCRLDPTHGDAKNFLRFRSDRKLSWRNLLEATSFSWKSFKKF